MHNIGKQIVDITASTVIQTLIDCIHISGRDHITLKELEETLERFNKRPLV